MRISDWSSDVCSSDLGELKRKLPRVTIFPKSHYVTPREKIVGMFDSIRDELNARIKLLRLQNKLIEAQRIEQRTQFDLEMIREIGYCNGRSEEHTSELQSLMRISYAVFCLKKKKSYP